MMAGLSFQVFSLLLFATATADYYLHLRKHYRNQGFPTAHPRIRWFLAALGLSYTCIMIRCIYRVIELSKGWNSPLMKKEKDFVVLEGVYVSCPLLFRLRSIFCSFGFENLSSRTIRFSKC